MASLKITARKQFVAYLSDMGYKVAHARWQRNGTLTVYLQVTTADGVTEVRWNPRSQFFASAWRIESNPHGRSLTSTLEFEVSRWELSQEMVCQLALAV